MQKKHSGDVKLFVGNQLGERQRFIEALYREFHGDLCRFLYRLNIENGQVDAVAHDVYVRILRMDELKKIEASPRSYLFKIAINIVRDQARRESRHRVYEMKQRLTADDRVAISTPEAEVEGEEVAAILQQAINDLSNQQRKILVLHRFQNLTCRDIAKEMGIPQRTVERYLSYALAFCQARLKGFGNE